MKQQACFTALFGRGNLEISFEIGYTGRSKAFPHQGSLIEDACVGMTKREIVGLIQ